MQPSASHWFRNTVLYQIYPRSFYDANGDGVGDLRGITEKLSYLAGGSDSLGVGAVWISPFYPSPMLDFGYDVSDYCDVDPLFGTIGDFKHLVEEAHGRGIKVIIDLIPNHTSSQHVWFKDSKRGKTDPRRDWYVWRDPAPDGGPPNNWLSVFGGSAWEYDTPSGQYYLHSFLKDQPDLNWANAGVRAAMQQVMRFWLDIGVDGFRADAVYWISKDPQFRDDPKARGYEGENPYDSLLHTHSKEGPHLHEYLQVLTGVLHAYDDRFMIIEASPDLNNISDSYMDLYDRVDPAVCAPFNFEGIYAPWKADVFRAFIDRFQTGMHPAYVPVYCFGNHDQPRMASRIGPEQARSAALLQLCLPGMPVIYYGDELGMKKGVIAPHQVRDPFEKQVPGKGLGRDPARTPMLWNASVNAGFSRKEPWLPVNEDYTRSNVDAQSRDPGSSYRLYKDLIALRAKYEVLRSGSYQPVDFTEGIYGFERRIGTKSMLVIINFTDNPKEVRHEHLQGNMLISSLGTKPRWYDREVRLKPHEAVLIEIV